ncbi:hypothetical protein [Actinopolymorpha alba]|uniref:hypothetical protein n=1 Tax=Actinopolymorpha alba TaxID=533267 RepID=UPI000373367E|nr:hypothetical protein [Actinopolymorpha alba]
MLPEGGRRYEWIGLLVAPADDDAVPVISSTQAIVAFEAAWGRRWGGDDVPEAALMVATNGEFCFDPGPGLRFAATVKDRLVWVLTWSQVHALVHGRGGRPAAYGRDPAKGRLVDGTAIIDATTADVLAVLEDGSEVPPSAACL